MNLLLIAGPTAVGKSEVALVLAERLGGEIVSVDSMQVYRGMDLGTAKPSAAQRARVPHHLIDVLEVTEPFDAAHFVRRAETAIQEIRARGRLPVLCGGTGLYFRALLEGLGDSPPADPRLRAELQAAPLPGLLEELARRDPLAYQRIDRRNPRRVWRAIEILRLTGKPIAEQKWTDASASLAPGVFGFGLCRPAADLHRRIEARVDDMFRLGLVAETQALVGRGLGENRTAIQALGYRQVAEHLRGERSLAETIELVKIRTRQFAKRQLTWFRRQARLRWLELSGHETPEAAADRVREQIERSPSWGRGAIGS